MLRVPPSGGVFAVQLWAAPALDTTAQVLCWGGDPTSSGGDDGGAARAGSGELADADHAGDGGGGDSAATALLQRVRAVAHDALKKRTRAELAEALASWVALDPLPDAAPDGPSAAATTLLVALERVLKLGAQLLWPPAYEKLLVDLFTQASVPIPKTTWW